MQEAATIAVMGAPSPPGGERWRAVLRRRSGLRPAAPVAHRSWQRHLRAEMKGMAKQQRESIAWQQLRLVKFEKFTTSCPHHYSGSVQTRVAIARALAYNPEVLLMGMKCGAGAFRAGFSTDIVQ